MRDVSFIACSSFFVALPSMSWTPPWLASVSPFVVAAMFLNPCGAYRRVSWFFPVAAPDSAEHSWTERIMTWLTLLLLAVGFAVVSSILHDEGIRGIFAFEVSLGMMYSIREPFPGYWRKQLSWFRQSGIADGPLSAAGGSALGETTVPADAKA
jgi:hypothetical protein